MADDVSFAEQIDVALHDICQPLTVLQCRLAMGELIGEPDSMREAIREALKECARLNVTVEKMRKTLEQMVEQKEKRKAR
ncbi:MAG: hypothetical protein M3Y50_17815 [Acidobacteriota bacterium]|nr:hypothetical protein [Acidobacteriota bacterium]